MCRIRDWYEIKIEEGVRDLVRLMRDNGFNTTSSCGHDMCISCNYHMDGVLYRLHQLLWSHFSQRGEKPNFKITIVHNVKEGKPSSWMEVEFPKGEGRLNYLKKEAAYLREQLAFVEGDIEIESNSTSFDGEVVDVVQLPS